MNGTDQQSGRADTPGATVYQNAERDARDIVERVTSGGDDWAGVQAEVYDKTTLIHQQYQISGGGPAAYVHFVIRSDGQIDHAYLEYVEASGRAVVGFSHTEAATLYAAMKDYR